MGRLHAIAGLPIVDPTPEVRAILAEHARLFLNAGGRLSLREWGALDMAERVAFVAANTELRRELAVEQAIRIGRASRGELGALRVQAELDGGEAHDDAQLAQAVRGLARASEEAPRGG